MALAGCDPSAKATAIEQRALPAKPDYVRPVVVADPAPTDKWRDVAARERAGRAKANTVIACFGLWYDGVRARYGGETPPATTCVQEERTR